MYIKKVLLLLLFIWVNQSNAQTNVYHPFPDSNAIWKAYSGGGYYCNSNLGMFEYKYQYTIGGDTVINPYTYKKIFISGLSWLCQPPWAYFHYFMGGLREDTVNKKVYLKRIGYNDTLLYDFGKNVGDSLHLAAMWLLEDTVVGYTFVINSIDSVLVGGNYRKRFNDYRIDTTSIIEGIGSTGGLLSQRGTPNSLNSGYGDILICFSHNTDLYPNDSTTCTLITGIQQYYFNNNISIYPNPTNDKFFIETNSTDKLTVDMYDVNGRHVLSTSVVGEDTIGVSSFDNGIYTLTIKSDDRVVNKKLVIAR